MTAARLPTLDIAPPVSLGLAHPLMRQLDKIVQRVVALHAELSDNHVLRLRSELALFERVLDEVQRELEWHLRMRASRLLAAGSGEGPNVLDWNPATGGRTT